MTEQEWLECTDPPPMLESLRGKASERKLRLFAVACCRRIWHSMVDERTKRSIEACELYADGFISKEVLRQREREGRRAWIDSRRDIRVNEVVRETVWAASVGIGPPEGKEYTQRDLEAMSSLAARAVDAERGEMFLEERAAQADLLRCVAGNPFHPITINPAWLTWHDGLLVSMAQRMYDSRDFSDMLVLADALEEAGCTNPDILGHCRSGGEHVRGCWVIDSLLRKS
jgi:hypothetical protein